MKPTEQLQEWWYRARSWYPVTMAGSDYRCDPDHISFWSRVTRGTWEPETFKVLERMIEPGAVHCDIGAWIGPTVLYGAGLAGKVYCFEPDREAYRYLLQNLRLNKLENVMPFNLGLSSRDSVVKMASPRGKRGDSMTSMLTPDRKNSMEVLCLSWLRWLELIEYPQIASLKMDVEGGEFELLPSMAEYLREHRPNLYLSLHPHLLADNEERRAAMQAIVDVVQFYGCFYTSSGEKMELEALLEGRRIEKGSSCLFMAG